MKKSSFITILLFATLATLFSCSPSNQTNTSEMPPFDKLPGQSDKAAVKVGHFPSRMHAFIWRNWGLVPAEKLATVLNTSTKNVQKVATSMGLQRNPTIDPVWLSSKGYITVLRRNWHLLPYGQILQLLDKTQEELEWSLYEDDFLFTKLGRIKPACDPLYWEKPTSQQKAQCKEIEEIAQSNKPKEVVPRFAFFENMPMIEMPIHDNKTTTEGLRMAFSYCAEYGDPLMDPNQESYPDELLQRLASQGINAVWVHSVLRMLVEPKGVFPGDEHSQERLKNLKVLVDRAVKYGIKVMLYVNEPRALPTRWFDNEERKAMAGITSGDLRTLCTSDPKVREWLSESYKNIFETVSELGGVFIISMSENLTNCASKGHQDDCPRCSKRPHDELIAEVNNTIAEGVLKGNPSARILVWDWGWNDDYAQRIIERLDKRCTLMSVSEWSLPIERGGVASNVGEYSISSIGPGPRAIEHWNMAQKAGLNTAAKVMVNASWELGSMPVIPAMYLIAEHAQHLAQLHTKDVIMTWSVGGYPSVNFAVFQQILSTNWTESDNLDQILGDIAQKFYGEQSGPLVRDAWKDFSKGFAEYPYNIGTLYKGPQQVGPANLLYLEPSGWKSTMVGFPYDDLKQWQSIYPTSVYIEQNQNVAEGFERGIHYLEKALEKETNPTIQQMLKTDLRRVNGIKCYFRSIVNQASFIVYRDENHREKMKEAILQEMKNVKEFIPLCDADPTFGYESSNHYFYVRNDLVEKVINLEWILHQLTNDNK